MRKREQIAVTEALGLIAKVPLLQWKQSLRSRLPGQYTSFAVTERLAEAGIRPSVGAVGSSYDNALAETINGLFKTELIRPRGPWRSADHVELATAEYVDWFNHRRLYQDCGDIPPAELEAAHYAQQTAQQIAELSHQ